MSYRSSIAAPTGTNNIPLGSRRRSDRSRSPPPSHSHSHSHSQARAGRSPSPTQNRGRSRSPHHSSYTQQDTNGEGQGQGQGGAQPKKERKSRWGAQESKLNLNSMNVHAAIPPNVSKEAIQQYAMHIRIEEIGRKLRNNDVVPPEHERSPSPTPMYGADGKRSNTRELRYKKKLEDERHKLVMECSKVNPMYRPPQDYRRPNRTSDKVYVPYKEFPEVNFIGQLLGPRGNSLKNMESQSGAKISIRGKGSIKEGKGRPQDLDAPGMDEELHCLVTADSEEKVAKAITFINAIIETAASTPEVDNSRKREQLRDLAAINGTLRDDENQTCNNCGKIGHRRFECPEQKNFTNNLTCHTCGGVGHISRDCTQRNNPNTMPTGGYHNGMGGPPGPPGHVKPEIDEAYAEFMTELNPAAGSGEPLRAGGHYGPNGGGGGGGGNPWNSGGGGGGAAPWKQQNHGGGGGNNPWSSSGPVGGGGGGNSGWVTSTPSNSGWINSNAPMQSPTGPPGGNPWSQGPTSMGKPNETAPSPWASSSAAPGGVAPDANAYMEYYKQYQAYQQQYYAYYTQQAAAQGQPPSQPGDDAAAPPAPDDAEVKAEDGAPPPPPAE